MPNLSSDIRDETPSIDIDCRLPLTFIIYLIPNTCLYVYCLCTEKIEMFLDESRK